MTEATESIVEKPAEAIEKAAAEAAKPVSTAAVDKDAKKTTSRKSKAKRRARGAQPKARKAAAQERNDDMNTNTKNWFAGFGAVPAAPFQSLFAEAGERGQKAAEELAELTRANVEALVEAGRIAVEGARSIGQDAVASGREGVEQAADAVRSLAEAKSPTEFVQLQTELARSSFDRLVAENSRLTESLVKLAGEAFQPLSTRASLNAERFNRFVA